MARVAFVADIHIANYRRLGGPTVSGINRRAQQILDSLQRAVEAAKLEDADAFVVLGDLFDSHKPTPQLLSAVQRILEEAPSPIILAGNHDVASAEPGDHALGPLAPVAQIVDRPTLERLDGVDLLLIPFHPDPGDSYLPRALEELARPLGPMETLVRGARGGVEIRAVERPRRILGLHLGIRDDVLPEYLRTSPDSIDLGLLAEEMRKAGVESAFAGNWHNAKDWVEREAHVFQVGALVPTGWDNPGHDFGWVAIFDGATGKTKRKQVPGPRFYSVRGGLLEAPPDRNTYLEWVVPPEKLVEASAAIGHLKETEQIAGGTVLPDRAVGEEKARTAAREARSEETITGALEAFVAEMPVPEGVERKEVLEAVLGFLGGKAIYREEKS